MITLAVLATATTTYRGVLCSISTKQTSASLNVLPRSLARAQNGVINRSPATHSVIKAAQVTRHSVTVRSCPSFYRQRYHNRAMLHVFVVVVIILSKFPDEIYSSQVRVQLPRFSLASCRPNQLICATSAANRSCVVRSKAQCVNECEHGKGQTACVGVNYRQPSQKCEIYYQCPSNYTIDVAGCQYIQTGLSADSPSCTVYINDAFPVPSYPYILSANCSYPFTYNGNLYYNCMPGAWQGCGFKACLTSNRTYVLCYPPADYQAQTTSVSLTVIYQPTMIVQSVFGWIVIQQRKPTFLQAYNWSLSWNSYKDGFGSSDSNFWLGLERMNLLTSSASYRLRIEVQQASTSQWFSAEYWSFTVGSEASSQYQLNIAGYSGDAGDSLQYAVDWNGDNNFGIYLHQGMKFTTFDKDNDRSNDNCAAIRGGGWWFNACLMGCLTCDDAHAQWCTLGLLAYNYTIKAARMMVKINA